jgi:homoserine O-acetyltransferase
VNAQHQVLTQHFNLSSVYAITGISMGGMQTFQWMASFPSFFEVAIPIVGSPSLSSYDFITFSLFIKLMESCQDDCQQTGEMVMMLEYLLGFTPEFHDLEVSSEETHVLLRTLMEDSKKYHVHDLLSQMRAIRNHNITSESMTDYLKVLSQFKGSSFIVYSSTDHLLLSKTSVVAAEHLNCKSLKIDTPNGHYAFWNDRVLFSEPIRDFLFQNYPNNGN